MKLTLDNAIGKQIACECGKIHSASIADIEIGSGVLLKLPELVKKHGGKKPFILDDVNTRLAAGERVREILSGFSVSGHTLAWEHCEPNELTVGSAIMHFEHDCDIVIAVGSGVVGDTAKILAQTAKIPLITVATAPSMDGYASATSSMCRAGLKVSIDSCCPVAIVADTDIIKNAPLKMFAAGVGDMVAKYLSVCEWRISNIITGEYYCEAVADSVRCALRDVVENVEPLSRREPEAVEAVMRGLILSGVSMTWAGLSRAASGVEHSISHIWDMRSEALGTPCDFHGIQCGIGTLIGLKMFEFLRGLKPNREKALKFVKGFDLEEYFDFLREYMGEASDGMISAEAFEGKYEIEKHAKRLERIIEKWDEICQVIDEELPETAKVENALKVIGSPLTSDEIGIPKDELSKTLDATKDIRDKYILTRLLWDIGELDVAKEFLQ